MKLQKGRSFLAQLRGGTSEVAVLSSPQLHFRAQHCDYVIGRDHAGKTLLFVDYGQSEKVVLIEEFGKLLFFGVFMAGNQRLLAQRQMWSRRGSENDFHQRHRAR